jgi:hypothetical protein
MKIIFNIMSTVSFLGVLTIAGGGVYVYANQEAIKDNIKAQVMEAITSALPGALGGGLPEVPGVGGGSPIPSAPVGLPGF